MIQDMTTIRSTIYYGTPIGTRIR